MRNIKNIHRAEPRHMEGLITFSPMPTRHLEQVDPFIFLNHHGPQHFPPHNRGLPFGPHPHRGMETVTFILDGDIMHKDNGGHESVITAGGIQWMTAGRGLLHSETSSKDFLEKGGDLEILQLWLNLPAKHKMTEPNYRGIQVDEIPVFQLDGDNATMHLIAGNYQGTRGAFQPLTDVTLSYIKFRNGSKFELKAPKDQNIFFYLVSGKLSVNGTAIDKLSLVEFENDGTSISITAIEDGVLLFGFATPFNEPMVAQGPFVMNTHEEIVQAYEDFRAGKMGKWHLTNH